MKRRSVGVESLTGDGHDVSPPLRPLTLRAVEEIVTGIDIYRTQTLLPELIEERILALEMTFSHGVIPGLTVLHSCDFRPMFHSQDDPHAVEPAEGLIFLGSSFRDILCPEAFRPHTRMVSLDQDPVASGLVFHSKNRSHLHVVRELGDDSVSLRSGTGLESGLLDSEVFPKRNRTAVQLAQRAIKGY